MSSDENVDAHEDVHKGDIGLWFGAMGGLFFVVGLCVGVCHLLERRDGADEMETNNSPSLDHNFDLDSNSTEENSSHRVEREQDHAITERPNDNPRDTSAHAQEVPNETLTDYSGRPRAERNTSCSTAASTMNRSHRITSTKTEPTPNPTPNPTPKPTPTSSCLPSPELSPRFETQQL